jgi:hypothetical protein
LIRCATTGTCFFLVKLVLLVLAGFNAVAFHLKTYRRAGRWDEDPHITAKARLAGAVSLLLWYAIIVSGRFIAYNWSV